MPKFGRGLNIEFAHAVKLGLINEPFSTYDVESFAQSRGWKPSTKYTAVLLPNGSAKNHSLTYKKFFVSVGNSYYILSDLAKREC